jgi:hypothetical protein
MARRTYGENRKKTVERSVKDIEVIESFLAELGVEKGQENFLEEERDSGEVEATARYQLVHPYEGENFRDALMYGDDVTARVEFLVDHDGSELEVYTGHITYDAHDIFDPASMAGVESEGPLSEEGRCDVSNIEAGESVDTGSAAALND